MPRRRTITPEYIQPQLRLEATLYHIQQQLAASHGAYSVTSLPTQALVDVTIYELFGFVASHVE